MKSKYQTIIDLYENIQTINGQFDDNHLKIMYKSPSSIHSDVTTTAYGIVEEKECVDISNGKPLEVSFILSKEEIKEKSFLLQVSACLDDWKKYINDIHISINDNVVVDIEDEFYENVCFGWPVKYYEIDNSLLLKGKNVVKIYTNNSSKGGLYVQFVNLVTRPIISDCMQISCQRFARKGDVYSIAVSNKKMQQIKVLSNKNCQVCAIEPLFKSNNTSVIKFKTIEIGQEECTITIGDTTISLILPEVVENSNDTCAVGFDSDDHMHYVCNEFERIPEYMMMEGLGSYLQFRPQLERNFLKLASVKDWEVILKRLEQFGIKVNLCDKGNFMAFLKDIIPNSYAGKHVHEPYLCFRKELIFNPKYVKAFHIDVDKLLNSSCFEESKQSYLKTLEETRDEHSTGESFSVGTPSLLCCYEAGVFDRVTMEPVSGINLELGGVRASAQATWGAHIPVEWYFGSPNDITKSRKFICSLLYCYMNGASYMYAENSIFKTNSFSREEFNNKFCMDNRKYLREFYDYSITHPRDGKIVVDLAVVYGNNEYIMWRDDERLAEISPDAQWDRELWGKWKEKGQHKFWRAVDAWLPFADNQNTNDEVTNLHLFSGTPYGQIDVVPYTKDFNKYKAIVFLGWNTYESGLEDKLIDFVSNGGTAYISYRHFNITDTMDKPLEYSNNEKMWKLFGVNAKNIIKTKGNILFDNNKVIVSDSEEEIIACETKEAKVIAQDESGNGIVFVNNYGKGKIYFSTIASYFTNDWVVDIDKEVLLEIGEKTAKLKCDNNNVAFTERITDNGTHTVDVLGMNTNTDEKSNFTLKYQIGSEIKTKSGSVNCKEILKVVL